MIPQRTITFIRIGLFVTLLLSWAVSCKKVKPKAPTADGFDPPIPPATSFVAGPITFSIRALEDKINEALKPELVTPETMKGQKGERFNLRVVRSGRIRIKYANNRVTFSAPLQVYIDNPLRLNKKKHSENALCQLAVDFQSPLQVANNWRLSTHMQFVNYTWIEKPHIRLLGINISVTKIADNLLRKRRADIEAAIDKAVHGGLRLDKQVRPIWTSLQKPLLLTKQPDSLWLIPTPYSVAAGDVTGTDSTLTVPIRVAFYTRMQFGPRPLIQPNATLPNLRKAHEAIRQTSDLRVMSFIPYADINRVLTKTLQGHNLDLAGGFLKINKATVYGGQQALIIRTDVGGAVKGTLYFRGQPAYDTLSHTLKVKNIDFDVETEERLLATADWLLHDNLKDTLARALHIPLREQILKIPMLIDRAFENSKTGQKNDLDILTFKFVPQRIAIRPDGIQALIKVETNVRFEVKKL